MKYFFTLLQTSVFVRNSFVLFVGTMVMNVLNYIFHFAIGRMVDAETYGALQSLIALLTIISVPAAALTLIATKYGAVAKARGDFAFGKSLFSYLNTKIIKYGWPIVVVGLLMTPLIKTFLQIDDSWAVILLWILATLTFFSSGSNGVLSGWQRFGAVNKANITGAGTKLFFGVFLAWIGWGLDGVVFGLVLSGIIGYIVSVRGLRFLKEKKQPSAASVEVTGSSFDASLVRGFVTTALIGTLSITILGNIDIVLAKHALDPEVAGAYGALAIVSKVIFFVTGVIAMVLFSMSSETVEKNTLNHTPQNFFVFWTAFGLTLFVVAVAVSIYFIAPQFVMGIFFGHKYLEVAPLLGWFGLAAGLYAIVNLMLQQLLSLQNIRAAQWLLGATALEAILLFFLGTSLFSIITIVLATQATALVVGLIFILKTCKMKVLNGG